MSSHTNLLPLADTARADAASKRPYRAPELRELGTVADLTQAGSNFPVDTDAAPYGS
jgi:hypothetical protein